jgi:allophanate hydrolase subunit 2
MFQNANASHMGYRLEGEALKQKDVSLLSSTVTFGTIQLLPRRTIDCIDGFTIQTTGGYIKYRNGNLNSLPALAQSGPGQLICLNRFHFEAERLHLAGRKVAKVKISVKLASEY